MRFFFVKLMRLRRENTRQDPEIISSTDASTPRAEQNEILRKEIAKGVRVKVCRNQAQSVIIVDRGVPTILMCTEVHHPRELSGYMLR